MMQLQFNSVFLLRQWVEAELQVVDEEEPLKQGRKLDIADMPLKQELYLCRGVMFKMLFISSSSSR